jgi:hypothetical protein
VVLVRTIGGRVGAGPSDIGNLYDGAPSYASTTPLEKIAPPLPIDDPDARGGGYGSAPDIGHQLQGVGFDTKAGGLWDTL